jgi:hypothetical protein
MTPKTTECINAFSKGLEAGPKDTIDCINSNPCLVGKMAYILGYDQFFTSFDYFNDATSVSVGCVPALVDNPPSLENPLVCQDGYAPVFNYSTGKIFCVGPP